MWIVIHIAKSSEAATGIQELLRREGILVKLRGLYRNRSEEENDYEVLVLAGEANEARHILLEKGI